MQLVTRKLLWKSLKSTAKSVNKICPHSLSVQGVLWGSLSSAAMQIALLGVGGAFFSARARLWLDCRATGESVLEAHVWMIFRYVVLAGPLWRAFWRSFCVLGWLLR